MVMRLLEIMTVRLRVCAGNYSIKGTAVFDHVEVDDN
jgi:hypothetical protein